LDNFDEFEFKPITEGLGFHNKTQKPKLDLSDTLYGKTLPSAPPKVRQEVKSQFTKLETERPVRPAVQPQQPARSKKGPEYLINNKVDFVESTEVNFAKREVPVDWLSIFFDSIVVLGLVGLFLFATFLIAKVEPLTVIKMIPHDPMTAAGMAVLTFSVIQGYLLISRSFFGSTLGEWAFEIEVGTVTDQESPLYPLRVVWRSFLIFFTGLIILPLLSLTMGYDVAGKISGVSLYRG